VIALDELSGRRAIVAARLYALEAENSGLREALRCLRADDTELARDLEAARTAQREADARALDELFAAAQMGMEIKPVHLVVVAERIRGNR
jgi:hypothetical protein